MVDYGKTIGDAFRFSIQPKKWLYFFILDSAVLSVLFAYVLLNTSALSELMSSDATFSSFVTLAAGALTLFAVWVLVRIYIIGALIHQSVNPRETKQSWAVSRQKYLSLLLVVLIVLLVTQLTAMVPYVGWIISILTGLMLFFAMPATVIGRMGAADALRTSFSLFREKLSDVVIAWLLISIISSVINLLLALPLIAAALMMMLPYLLNLETIGGMGQVLSLLISNSWSLVPALLVFLAGFAISNVFTIHAQCNVYLQLKKRKLL